MLKLADLVLGPENSEELEQAANTILEEQVSKVQGVQEKVSLLECLKEKNKEFLFQQADEELSANSFETRDCSILDQINSIIEPELEEHGSPFADQEAE